MNDNTSDPAGQARPYVELSQQPEISARKFTYWPAETITAGDLLAIAAIIRDANVHPAASVLVDTIATDLARVTRLVVIETDEQQRERSAPRQERAAEMDQVLDLLGDGETTDPPATISYDMEHPTEHPDTTLHYDASGKPHREFHGHNLDQSGVSPVTSFFPESIYRDNPMGYAPEDSGATNVSRETNTITMCNYCGSEVRNGRCVRFGHKPRRAQTPAEIAQDLINGLRTLADQLADLASTYRIEGRDVRQIAAMDDAVNTMRRRADQLEFA